MMECYMKLANVIGSPDLHLFRGIVLSKNGVRLRAQGDLCYTRMCELLLEKLAQVGLRSGGTTAAANAGVPDC
jgi:hypothetical protein